MKNPKDDHAADALGYYGAIHKNLNAFLAANGKSHGTMVYFGVRQQTAAELALRALGHDFDAAIDAILKHRP